MLRIHCNSGAQHQADFTVRSPQLFIKPQLNCHIKYRGTTQTTSCFRPFNIRVCWICFVQFSQDRQIISQGGQGLSLSAHPSPPVATPPKLKSLLLQTNNSDSSNVQLFFKSIKKLHTYTIDFTDKVQYSIVQYMQCPRIQI